MDWYNCVVFPHSTIVVCGNTVILQDSTLDNSDDEPSITNEQAHNKI